MATLHEQVMQRVEQVLQGAGTSAGARVERGRVDALPPEALPATNVVTGDERADEFAERAMRVSMEFELHHMAAGSTRETAADLQHQQCHAALMADPTLAGLVVGLRYLGKRPEPAAGETPVCKLVCTYRCQGVMRLADLTRMHP